MNTFPEESPRPALRPFLFVFVLFVLLMAVAEGSAQFKVPLGIGAGHSVDFRRVIFTIWVAIVLLTPALCVHVFSRRGAPNSYWRAFWTFAYLALLTHLCWAGFGTCHGDFAAVLDGRGADIDAECIVGHPWPDLFLAAWWGLDVILAWLVTDDVTWVRVERHAVHLLAFVMFFAAFVLDAKASFVARVLGILMALAVPACVVLRLILRRRAALA